MGNEQLVAEFNALAPVTGAEILEDLRWFRCQLAEEKIAPPRGSVLHDGLEA
jgi:hypothetical protein